MAAPRKRQRTCMFAAGDDVEVYELRSGSLQHSWIPAKVAEGEEPPTKAKKRKCIVTVGQTTHVTSSMVADVPSQPQIANLDFYLVSYYGYSTDFSGNFACRWRIRITGLEWASSNVIRKKAVWEVSTLQQLQGYIGEFVDVKHPIFDIGNALDSLTLLWPALLLDLQDGKAIVAYLSSDEGRAESVPQSEIVLSYPHKCTPPLPLDYPPAENYKTPFPANVCLLLSFQTNF